MSRYAGIIIIVLIVLAVIIGLSAAGSIELDQPIENEFLSNRSSYNSGPTGTRAFFQLLEESGFQVSRWRDDYHSLKTRAADSTLIVVGPYLTGLSLQSSEATALQEWVADGGRVLIISRFPREQFGDPVIHSKYAQTTPGWSAPPEKLVFAESDELIVQPTVITQNIRGLALSGFATRLKFHPPEPGEANSGDLFPWSEQSPPPAPSPGVEKSDEEGQPDPNVDPSSTPGAEPSPSSGGAGETPGETQPESDEDTEAEGEYFPAILYAPVIHLGDKDGAVLAEFTYGKGRVIFLSDPFAIANNGIARGSNLTLAFNILSSLGGPKSRIFFDEYHHGYHNNTNPLAGYFRGTPVPWLLLQASLLCLIILYTFGRRFSRPLPLPRVNRHSPLEFVGSMANLQQAARARELAIENIYPRFKAQLCRRLGLSTRASKEEIIESARRQRLPVSAIELRQIISDAELTLAGEKMDDARLVSLVSRMRRTVSQIRR